jgi:hypothetical protein
MHQVASSETVLEIEHACTHCPLEPQRLAYLNGTTDDCAGDLGHLDIVRPERKRTRVRPFGMLSTPASSAGWMRVHLGEHKQFLRFQP